MLVLSLFLCAVGEAVYLGKNVLPKDVFGCPGMVRSLEWDIFWKRNPVNFALFCSCCLFPHACLFQLVIGVAQEVWIIIMTSGV